MPRSSRHRPPPLLVVVGARSRASTLPTSSARRPSAPRTSEVIAGGTLYPRARCRGAAVDARGPRRSWRSLAALRHRPRGRAGRGDDRGNVIALGFTVVFARVLGASGYGSLAGALSAFIIMMVPGSALQIAVAREVSHDLARGQPERRGGRAPLARRGSPWPTLVVAVVAIPLRAADRGADQRRRGLGGRRHAGHGDALGDASRSCAARCRASGTYRAVGAQHRRRGLVAARSSRSLLVGVGLDVTGAFLGIAACRWWRSALVLAMPLRPRLPAAVRGVRAGRACATCSPAPGRPVLALTLLFALQEVHVIVVKHEADERRRRLLRGRGGGRQGDHLGRDRARALPAAGGRAARARSAWTPARSCCARSG